MRIYVAGPLGFSEAGKNYYYGKIIPELRRLGHEVLDPWKLTDQSKIDHAQGLAYGVARRDAWTSLTGC